MLRAGSPRVAALFVSSRHLEPMQARADVRAREDHGLEGDAHARPGGSRQVLLLEAETLAEFGVAPGQLKENITTAGLNLAQLPAGARLRVGGALLEVVGPCAPCALVDAVQPGLREKLQGRRGQLARVVEGGAIRVGDLIKLLGP